MRVKYEFAIQKVTDGYVAVTVGDDAEKSSGLLRMNRSAAFMMEQMKREITEEQLVDKLVETFDADRETLQECVRDFVLQLQQAGVLEL